VEEEKSEEVEEREEMGKSITFFFTVISNEVRNPLNLKLSKCISLRDFSVAPSRPSRKAERESFEMTIPYYGYFYYYIKLQNKRSSKKLY